MHDGCDLSFNFSSARPSRIMPLPSQVLQKAGVQYLKSEPGSAVAAAASPLLEEDNVFAGTGTSSNSGLAEAFSRVPAKAAYVGKSTE
jgi:hypothetical protein